MADEEKDREEIETEKLLRLAKKSILNRLNTGKDVPPKDYEYLVDLEKRLKEIRSESAPPRKEGGRRR